MACLCCLSSEVEMLTLLVLFCRFLYSRNWQSTAASRVTGDTLWPAVPAIETMSDLNPRSSRC